MLTPARWWHRSQQRMYRHGRPDRLARVMNRVSAFHLGTGLAPKGWVTLEVRGRHTGRLISSPGARPHIPVDRHAPLDDFERIAAQIPVVRITADRSAARDGKAGQPATGTPG